MYAISENTSFTDNGAMDIFHNYYVTAISDLGESDPSNICNTQPEGDCNAPSGLRYEMVNNKVKLIWEAPQGDAPTGYFVYRRTRGEVFKRIKSITNTTYSDNINPRKNEIYEYAVAAYYSAGDCTSPYASIHNHPELNFLAVNKTDIPCDLGFLISGNDIILFWKEALQANSYNVYRDGERIAHGLTYPTFTDANANPQHTYRYFVTGSTDFMESNPSNEVYIDWTVSVNENIENQEIEIYPNPTNGVLFVETRHGTSLPDQTYRITNLMGQTLLSGNVINENQQINISNLPEGTYFIKIESEQEQVIRKIVKIK